MVSLRRPDVLLLLGMLGGAALAARGLVRDAPGLASRMPPDAVAMVNGEPVARSAFETALGLVERDRRQPASPEERRRILDRLVDEELLLQRGLELGLPRSDRKLRGDLVAAVIDAATAGAASEEPSAAELQAFFDANLPAFTPPPPLRVAQVFVATGPRSEAEAGARAAAAAARLRAGEDLASVRRDLGDPPAVEVPSSPVPATRLRDTLGPAAAEAAWRMEPGQVSDPLRGDDGYRVLLLLERLDPPSPTLAPERDKVLAEYRRRRGEEALRALVGGLRRDGDVRLVPPLPPPPVP